MKKYIFMAIAATVLGMTSCTDSVMDDINKNEQDPSGSLVSANLQISDAIMSTAFSTVSGDYAFYTSTLTEQLFGTGNNQLMKAELRNAGELAAPSTFNNVWNSTYANLLNIKEMIDKVENSSANSGGMYDVLGAAQVLWCINFGILTDMHGDIPYTDALQGAGNMNPSVTSQKDVYASLIKVIDSAIENLTKAKKDNRNNMGKVDLAYSGDPAKWLAAAYAVKARLCINQTCVDPNAAQKALDAANEAITNGFDGLLVREFNGVTCDNPFSAFQWSREYLACSKTVTDIMGADDPRLYVYTYDEEPNDVCAAPGDEAKAKESATWCFPAIYDQGSQPVHIMSEHELYFIKAEAQLRLDQDATDAFTKAVTLSITEQGKYGAVVEAIPTYLASLGTPDLKKVFEQKYIAGAIDEQVVTYTDIRRCMGMGENFITLTNPKNIQGGQNRWPYLLPYGESSLVSNPNLKAVDTYAKQCWLFTK